jgi:3-oxoacyl-[acyl-carrier protein] reductase
MSDGRHTAFISGSGRNIGRAIAGELARQGCNIVLNGLTNRAACDKVAAEIAGSGGAAIVVMGDVGDSKAVRAMADAALERFGRVDILVNNAPQRGPARPFIEMTDEDWHRIIAVELHSCYYLSRAFLPGMCANGWGRIVNLTGLNAIAGHPGRAHVAAAKQGLWGLTKALANEFGAHGVTANALSPWRIKGDADIVEAAETVAKFNSLGRRGTLDEIAKFCAFLCSDDAAFISGQMIGVDGAAVAA